MDAVRNGPKSQWLSCDVNGLALGTSNTATILVECDGAACITEGSCAHQGLVHACKYVGFGGRRRETCEGQLRSVCGVHDLAIGDLNGDWSGRRLHMAEERGCGKEVPCAAGI